MSQSSNYVYDEKVSELFDSCSKTKKKLQNEIKKCMDVWKNPEGLAEAQSEFHITRQGLISLKNKIKYTMAITSKQQRRIDLQYLKDQKARMVSDIELKNDKERGIVRHQHFTSNLVKTDILEADLMWCSENIDMIKDMINGLSYYIKIKNI